MKTIILDLSISHTDFVISKTENEIMEIVSSNAEIRKQIAKVKASGN